MKDLTLSFLSRGCGRLVSSSGNPGRQDGRLDVCFTPQDYYIWKSKETLLRLSESGRLFAEAESTLPKTYSTRKGPLLLYSQELAAMENNHRPDVGIRRKKVIRRDAQQVERRLKTLKELTAAILSYTSNQSVSSRLAPPLFPPVPHPPAPDLHCTSPALFHTTPAQPRPEFLVAMNPQWLHTRQNTELEKQPTDSKEEQDNRRVRVDLFLQIPRASRPPAPQMKPQPWVHYVAMSPHTPEEPQTYMTDSILQHSEISHHITGEEICVRPRKDDQEASVQDGRNAGNKDELERSISGSRYGRRSKGRAKQLSHTKPQTITTSGLLLHSQQEGRSVCNRPCWDKKDKPTCVVPSPKELRPQRLPPIAEGRTLPVRQGIHSHTQQDAQPLGGRVWFQAQENLNALHQRTSLPLLCPEQEEPCPPVAGLGCVAGRKGPGKQCSSAFLHSRAPDLHEPCESSDTNRAVVKGVLPLELRDFQNGKMVGCVILGPDGEIIHLSLQGDGDSQQQALQVLTTEGEELPWVIVLQPEPTDAEGGAELNGCVSQHGPQHHRSISKDVVDGVFQDAESCMSVGRLAKKELSFSPEQLADLHRSTETNTCSPRGDTDTVAVTKKKTKSAEARLKTWKEPQKAPKHRVRMPPLREQVWKEKLGGGSSAEEEEEEDLLSTEQNGYTEKLQNISLTEATTKDDVDKKKGAKEVTAGQRETQPVESAESDEQGRSLRKDGKQQSRKPRVGDVQSTRSQKQEGRTSREAGETQDHSAPPSVKKKMKDRERGRGEIKMNKEREDREESSRHKGVPVGRRRKSRGRLKHKELLESPLQNDERERNQEMPQDPHQNSTRLPSAAQTHSGHMTAEDDTDPDDLSTSGKRSSSRSVSSLGSTAPSSQLNARSSVRSIASFCEQTVPASAVGLASSRGRLSSCSAVMITEEQLMLNPVKPEFSRPTKVQEEEEAAAPRLAQRAERRRQEEERRRRQREEEERKQQEREQTEDRMKSELQEERRRKAEELRLKTLTEEEERRKREEGEQERARREQAQREKARRRQEEMRRQIERLHRMREEEEQRRKAELKLLQLEEEKQRLQEMDESDRTDYLRRKEQEEKDRRNKEEACRREQEAALLAAEEARLQAELLTRQMTVLQQQLAFKRSLMLEAGGLETTQGISRPWIYSYFALLDRLGPNPDKAETRMP